MLGRLLAQRPSIVVFAAAVRLFGLIDEAALFRDCAARVERSRPAVLDGVS